MKKVFLVFTVLLAFISLLNCVKRFPVEPPEPTPTPYPYNITLYALNCSGVDYTDTTGQFWEADHAFDGTHGCVYWLVATGTTADISNTQDDPLYNSYICSTDASDPVYSFAVNPGKYLIVFKFTSGSDGVFSIEIEGTDEPSLTNFSITNTAGGGYLALDRAITRQVDDGFLDIKMKYVSGGPGSNNACGLAAIKIGLIPDLTATPTPGGTATLTPTATPI